MSESGERDAFITDFNLSKENLGVDSIEEGSGLFDQLVRIMADLSEENSVSIQSLKDRDGLLDDILKILRDHHLNLTSLHSFKTQQGHRFRIGLEKRRSSSEVRKVLNKIGHDLRDEIQIMNPLLQPT